MKPEHQAFWEKVNHFDLDAPEAAYTLTDRLAHENHWPLEFTVRVVQEYKRFMFLICIAPHPLSPSDPVDQTWHLHLIYTRAYWEDFCEGVLGRKIHHSPTQGGSAESSKYANLYAKTLAFYTEIFGHPPPADIWPTGKARSAESHFKRVNTSKYWIIPKPKLSL